MAQPNSVMTREWGSGGLLMDIEEGVNRGHAVNKSIKPGNQAGCVSYSVFSSRRSINDDERIK